MIAPAAFLRNPPLAGGADANPFIPIARGWRRAVIAYYAIWLVATPVLQEIALPSTTPLAGVRVGLDVLYQTLLFLPILLYRPWFGWLHPLIFPALFRVASDLVKTPGELLRPLGIGLVPREPVLHLEVLPWYSEQAVAIGELRLQMVLILGVLAYYGGFFLLSRGTPGPAPDLVADPPDPRRVRLVALSVVGAAGLGLAVYLIQRGGIQAHLLAYWGGGRGSSETSGGVGIALVALDVWMAGLLLWYTLDLRVQRNPLFMATVLCNMALVFLLSGSRSNLFNTIVLFVIVWMLRHRKMPTGRVAVIGLLVLVLLGPLGDFRRSVTRSGQVDWGMLLDLRGAVASTNSEIAMRASRGGGVPVMIRVPSEVGLLKGKSYVGGLLFFVPRILWKTKPHGAANYNSTMILGRGAYGAPIPAEAEAYWNFGIPGVLGIFLLFGAFHRYLAGLFARYGEHPVAWGPYILALFAVAPSSLQLTNGVRIVGAAFVILAAMGARMPRPRSAASSQARPTHGFRVPAVPQSSGT
jgi:hypothetical protein